MSDLALSAASRTNLLALQRTQILIDRTQNRLASGLKVNSALDDAMAFFTARNLNSRAADLSAIKDGVSTSLSILTTATQGLTAIANTLKQMKALAQSAISSPESTTRASFASQFNELRSQVDAIAEDASFNGVNLLKRATTAFTAGGDYLTIRFNERTDTINQLVVSGLRAADFTTIMSTSVTATGTGGDTTVWGQTGSAAVTAINAAIKAIDKALDKVESTSQSFGTNAALLGIRQDFTSSLVTTLNNGAAVLVNADLNEESANLLAAQTRQQLGLISLSIAQRSDQAVLRMF